MRMMTASSLAIRGLVLLLAIVTALGIPEVLLRLFGYTYTPLRIQSIQTSNEWRYFHAFRDEHFEYDPFLIWRPRKGIAPFNSLGYRGREINPQKAPGEVRILAVGDSNTLGWLGAGDFNWPAHLDERLAAKNHRVVVMNAGVYGYTSFQGLRRLEQSLALQPDLVLVSFGWNDALNATMSDADFVSKPIRAQHVDEILVRSRVGQLLLATYDRFGSGRQTLVPRVNLQGYRDNLREMILVSRGRGIQLVILTRPFIDGSGDQTYNQSVLELAKEAGVHVIDVNTYFLDKPELFTDDSHFTEAGHRLMAVLIEERISPLLPR
jgi:lysophospholipase L1-like esterase